MLAFRWDGQKGTLEQFQAVKTLREGFTDPSTAAEIMVRKDGRFLYVSNRGEDTLVVYAIDAKTGELTLRQRIPSRGRVPRFTHIRIDALDRKGKPFQMELRNFPARVVQHETDHLDGVLFFDRMEKFDSLTFLEEFTRYHRGSDADEEEA